MLVFLLKLLLAHFIGDFLLQPKSWVTDKQKYKHKSKYMFAHIAIHFFLILVLLQFQFQYLWALFYILS